MAEAHVKINFSPIVAHLRKVEEGVYKSVQSPEVKVPIYRDLMFTLVKEHTPVTGATADSIGQLLSNEFDGERITVTPKNCTRGIYTRESGGYIDEEGIHIDPVDLYADKGGAKYHSPKNGTKQYKGTGGNPRNFHYGEFAVDILTDFKLNYEQYATSEGLVRTKDKIIEKVKEYIKQ